MAMWSKRKLSLRKIRFPKVQLAARKATKKLWKDLDYRLKMSKAMTKANKRSWKDPKIRKRRIRGMQKGQRASYASDKGVLRRKRISAGKANYFADMSREERAEACAHFWQASFNTKKNTRIEKVVHRMLRKAKIPFRRHKRIGRFVPDIFIKPNICVFVDGAYWHCRQEREISDRRITRELRKLGYRVVRLSEYLIKIAPMRCLNMVIGGR